MSKKNNNKKGLFGNNVSHSKKKTRHIQKKNIQKKKIKDISNKYKYNFKISVKILRNLLKNNKIKGKYLV